MKSFNLSQQPTMCPTIHTFIGFQKASDYIHRGMMIKILGVYGVPPCLLKALYLMYQDIFAEILTRPNAKTAWYQLLLQNGVIHGNTQVPFLIIIVPDYALSQVICKIRIVPEKDQVMKVTVYCHRHSELFVQNSYLGSRPMEDEG